MSVKSEKDKFLKLAKEIEPGSDPSSMLAAESNSKLMDGNYVDAACIGSLYAVFRDIIGNDPVDFENAVVATMKSMDASFSDEEGLISHSYQQASRMLAVYMSGGLAGYVSEMRWEFVQAFLHEAVSAIAEAFYNVREVIVKAEVTAAEDREAFFEIVSKYLREALSSIYDGDIAVDSSIFAKHGLVLDGEERFLDVVSAYLFLVIGVNGGMLDTSVRGVSVSVDKEVWEDVKDKGLSFTVDEFLTTVFEIYKALLMARKGWSI